MLGCKGWYPGALKADLLGPTGLGTPRPWRWAGAPGSPRTWRPCGPRARR